MPRPLDTVRARAFGWLERAPGRLGAAVRRANQALGRPLASAEELADRAAFARGYPAAPAPSAGLAPTARGTAAPVVVYHLDKHRRDLPRLCQVLDARDIPYRTMSLEDDPATIAAVRRDAGGRKLPLVFVAGACVGGREELHALDQRGELEKLVWPA